MTTPTLPPGWTGGEHFQKWWRGKIMQLYTLHRKCAQCGNEMRLDVTKAALEGKAKNAGMHLKRCVTCRAKTRAIGASSRPRVQGEIAPRRVHVPEETTLTYVTDETLRTANATMKEELEALYATVKELRERLAKYEQTKTAANGAKMPWEK